MKLDEYRRKLNRCADSQKCRNLAQRERTSRSGMYRKIKLNYPTVNRGHVTTYFCKILSACQAFLQLCKPSGNMCERQI